MTAGRGRVFLAALMVFAFAAGALGAHVLAQQTPATGEPRQLAPRDPARPRDDQRQVRINHAERARYDSARGLFYLFGKVEFQDEDVTLFCDEATYNENDDTAACAGNLRIVDGENVITGNVINADFEAEIINIEGNVKIVTTKTLRSSDSDDAKKRVTTITCDKIVYTYTEGRRKAVATGNLKAVQEDKTVVAARAEYDREKDIITLTPKVTITMDNGNEFNADTVIISVTDDLIEMQPLRGVMRRDRAQEQPAPAPPAEQPAEPSG